MGQRRMMGERRMMRECGMMELLRFGRGGGRPGLLRRSIRRPGANKGTQIISQGACQFGRSAEISGD
jgi:hypothetical protein